MSSTGTEQVIISAKANVMVYDDVNKKWNPSGSSPGLSKVYIYQNLLNQTYRVVGRKVQDHECVINCMLSKSIKYQANQTFLQWRDVKQVYGLHFGSKDEADHFTQILKTAVENLTRVAANNLNMNGNGDNISLGKRSISSEYTNPLITDEYERQQQFNNNMNGHNNGTNIYTGINTQRPQQQQQHHNMQNNNNNNHNQVTSPPLSNSSSSSSSTISSNGLLNTINGQPNGNGMSHHQNGNNYNGNNNYNLNSYPNNQIYNLQQQNNNGHNINTSSTSSSSSSSSTSSVVQQPLYQSSPIPPPPPPPPGNILGLLNGSVNNNTISNNSNNSHANDNCSQKIYDIIPDNASYTPNHNNNNNSAPPPPPLPTGLFNSAPSNGAPPPPPPIASMQSLNLNNNNSQQQSSSTNSNSMASELARSIANRPQLKKVEDSQPAPRQAAPPQLDFLTEIRQKLEAKNRNETSNGTPSNDNENLKPSNGLKKINRNAISSDSPKPIKKITSTPNVVQNGSSNGTNGHLTNGHTNGHANGHLDGQSYDKLKQELMSEFRKELQMIKQDIVNSILNELRR